MKKYKFDELALEITRRCNKQCVHCMKGNVQDLSMTKEIIDRIFEDVADCYSIALTGGESLLHIDLIGYLVDSINQSSWNTKLLQLTTNGSILNEDIIKILSVFCNGKSGRKALLRISNDKYHDPKDYRAAYGYYSNLVGVANSQLTTNSIIECTFTKPQNEELLLRYSGRAIDLVDRNTDKYAPNGNTVPFCAYSRNHRIKIEDINVRCEIEILATGGVCLYEERSYDLNDELAIGNILKDNLSSIIDEYNNSCLLLCSEREDITYCKQFNKFSNLSENCRLHIKIYRKIINRILELRELAKHLYPHVPAQDIISALPVPSGCFDTYLGDIYIHSKYMDNVKYASEIVSLVDSQTLKNFANDYQRLSTTELKARLIYIVTLAHLNDTTERRYPFELYGTEDDILQSEAFRKLARLNRLYKTCPTAARNDKIYECESDFRLFSLEQDDNGDINQK